MAITIREEDAVDRGQPNRTLNNGTHPATILYSDMWQGPKGVTLKVEVVVHPDKKEAPEGPVISSTYLPTEITDKVHDLSRLGNYMRACGGKVGTPFEEKDQVGKAIRVSTKWEKSRDPQYRDRAEIVGFLPPLPGQKPMSVPTVAAPEDPFAQPSA